MLSWAICICRRIHEPSVKNEFFYVCDNTNKRLTYALLGGAMCTEIHF